MNMIQQSIGNDSKLDYLIMYSNIVMNIFSSLDHKTGTFASNALAPASQEIIKLYVTRITSDNSASLLVWLLQNIK